MNKIPEPIFQNGHKNINWMKIYSREYGVSYSEMAILCLSPKAKYHIPSPSEKQIIIPDGNNTVFYIDALSWESLVNSLNKEYTDNNKKLYTYEKNFEKDGKNYLKIANIIAKQDITKLSNKELLNLYRDYQDKLFTYSVFAWTSFILNDFVAKRATKIIEKYLIFNKLEIIKQEVLDSLFAPQKLAAVLELQREIENIKGKINTRRFNELYEKYKWLSCLDLHNSPWTKTQFKETIKTLKKQSNNNKIPFNKFAEKLRIKNEDLIYLLMAQKFVYIKDARDDYRRQGVYLALPFFKEIAKRMKINNKDITYIKTAEVVDFLENGVFIPKKIINERKKGFVMYLDKSNKIACVSDKKDVKQILTDVNLMNTQKTTQQIKGMTASKGKAKGKVAIIHGVKDLHKVKKGYILVAVTTHPDYTIAMRKAAAIITDEGGITSHAAIVSREFGIPCIVGTKNAARVLKDGDFIEIDADNGEVKIINQ